MHNFGLQLRPDESDTLEVRPTNLLCNGFKVILINAKV
jgi:hypothetical protein